MAGKLQPTGEVPPLLSSTFPYRSRKKEDPMRDSTCPRRRALVASTAVLLLCGGQYGVVEALTLPNAGGGAPSASPRLTMMTAAASRGPSQRGVSAARMLSDASTETCNGNGRWKSGSSPLFSSGSAFAHRHAALVGGRVGGARQHSDTSATRLQAMPMSNLAVRLDEPLLSPALNRRPPPMAMFKYLLSVFLSDAFKFAVVAFLIAFVTSIVARSDLLSAPKGLVGKAGGGVASLFRWLRAPFLRMASGAATRRAASSAGPAVPMTFEGEGGWGVCTYQGGEAVGKSGYVRHDFSLPSPDNVLPLTLGQHVALCCLDNSDKVVQAEFYPYSERSQQGKFSILLPEGTNFVEDENELGPDKAGLSKVLKTELEVGDEIALKPGGVSLEYRGQYLPVKEMVFLCSGEGVVPVMEQVRAVLPEGSSSVQLVSVLWLCRDTKDFDIADTLLEAEYRKYPSKLAVTCVDDDLRNGKMEDNKDVVDAVPDFLPGTMAIVTGPRSFRRKAKQYLLNAGYPNDTICVME